MSFLLFVLVGTGLAATATVVLRRRPDHRTAMRQGMALALTITGVDHFVSAGTRYVPMMPDVLAPWALALVYGTGAAELLGALGLLLPKTLGAGWGWPNLQRHAGMALAAMFCVLVVANINVAIKGTGVDGLTFFGPTYLWVRPLMQPIYVVWVLYAVGVWPRAGLARRASARRPEPARRMQFHPQGSRNARRCP